jgi:hypothetical protein
VIEHGGSIDLSTIRPFSSAGFAGTLRSTLVLRLGRARRPHFSDEPPDFGKPHRVRDTEVSYRVKSVTGSVGFAFSGLGDPAQCLALDACGETGSVTLSPAASAGTFVLDVETPASRPRRDIRTLFGIARGGDPRGLVAGGYGAWTSRAGAVNASFSWQDGTSPCTDAVPLRSGTLSGELNARRFEMVFGGLLDGDVLHTRCGGPVQSDVASVRSFASGSVPIAALRRKQLTIHLTRYRAIVPTAAWQGSVKSALTVTLVRTRVRERVFTERY